MPKRAAIVTRDHLKQVPLPTHASSYTVITHETVITNAIEQLKLKGFKVKEEKYRSNNSGEVAVGSYQLEYGNDPDLGMMFAWANSYDKSMRFKCAVGGFVRTSNASIISGDFSWGRKHTGTADQEMISQVNNQILNAQSYYDNIVTVKDEMKNLIMSPDDVVAFLGRAFFLKGLFSKEQIGVVRDEMLSPSFSYGNPSTLWSYYNYMLIALAKAHPRTWMEEQRDLHNYICNEYNLGASVIPVAPVVASTVVVTAPEVIEKVEDNLSLDEITETKEAISKAGVDVVKMAAETPSALEILVEAPEDVALVVTNSNPEEEEEEPEVEEPVESDSTEEEEASVVEDEKPQTNEILGEEITDAEQKLIDERMEALLGTSSNGDLNL